MPSKPGSGDKHKDPACNHTPHPIGYIAYANWADRMAKTHRQIPCESCGLWAVWVPKKARAKIAREG